MLLPPLLAAACAGGPCLSPETVAVLLRPGSTDVAVHTNFGIILSTDAGATWELACEEIYNSTLANRDRVDPSGRFLVATYDGLFASADRGCSWSKGGGSIRDDAIWDLALDPINPTKMWAVASNRSTGEASIH